MGFKLLQMDVKLPFWMVIWRKKCTLNNQLEFEDANLPNHVLKLNKSLYAL